MFGKIAKACNKTPYNTVRMLQRNISKELANVDVVSVIKEHTGLSQEQILIKIGSMWKYRILVLILAVLYFWLISKFYN